ncbi:RNaseH domain-containing protein [Streptomyces sp. NPDC058662]|uniref:RNaseH domain-containing protein n=1 Tax=Streptomyces sp. NPDC058662 TaxID=3346583 RepID=UPI003658BF02
MNDEQDAGPGGAAEQVLDAVETTRTFYQVTTEFGPLAWTLCNVPRGYDGAGADRLGSKRTWWDAKRSVHSKKKEERRKDELPQNWYSMTGTEIHPIACSEGASEEALAVATAKLCHQTLFSSDRARFPVALDAAKQMDSTTRSTGARRPRKRSRLPSRALLIRQRRRRSNCLGGEEGGGAAAKEATPLGFVRTPRFQGSRWPRHRRSFGPLCTRYQGPCPVLLPDASGRPTGPDARLRPALQGPGDHHRSPA